MSNSTEKRTELVVRFNRNSYCCGIVEIGDFELRFKNRYDRNAEEPPQLTFDEGLAAFQKTVKKWVIDEYYIYPSERDEDEYGESCLLRATVNRSSWAQEIAEEYLKADGWDLVAEFNNVNSHNDVFCYQKTVPAGEWVA